MTSYRTMIVVSLAIAAPALAGPKQKQEARRHVDRATKAHAAGKLDDALAELKLAYKLDPKPELLYAIGQVYSGLGKCSDATTYFKEFLAKEKKAKPEVTTVIDEAIAACTPAKAAAEPEPAEGEPPPPSAWATPESPTSPPPPSAPQPTAPPAPPPTPTAAPPAPPPTPTAAPPPSAMPAATPPRVWYRDVPGDALVVGGVVTAVIGLVVYNSARSDLDSAEAAGSIARYDQLVDDAHSARTDSVLLIGAGAVLVGAGIVRYVVHDRGRETSRLGFAPARSGGLVTWAGGF